MDINDTRKCNLWNLELLARYLSVDSKVLIDYYHELLEDAHLLAELNNRLVKVREQYSFTKAIFKRDSLPSIDWFAFERVLLYVLMRHLKPKLCLETGVYYGGNTAFLLAGLARNGAGKLISIDLPDFRIRQEPGADRHPLVGDSELYDESLQPGFIIPDYLRPYWQFIQGDSLVTIPTLTGALDFFIHDSEHSFAFIQKELSLVLPKLTPAAVIVADDVDWSNGFYGFCFKEHLHPILFTDNGKDNLRVRIGLTKLDHPYNRVPEITGAS